MQGPGGLGRDGAGEGWAEEEEPMAAAALSLLAGAWLAGRVLLPGLTGRAGWVGTVIPCRFTMTMAPELDGSCWCYVDLSGASVCTS